MQEDSPLQVALVWLLVGGLLMGFLLLKLSNVSKKLPSEELLINRIPLVTDTGAQDLS